MVKFITIYSYLFSYSTFRLFDLETPLITFAHITRLLDCKTTIYTASGTWGAKAQMHSPLYISSNKFHCSLGG